jgi:hypothetical protein
MAMAPRAPRKAKYPKAVKKAHEAAAQSRLKDERAQELDALRAKGAVAASGRRPLLGWFGQSANERLEQHLVRSGRARSADELAAHGGDDPAARRREHHAGVILEGMERAVNEGRRDGLAHFYSRHGASTAIESHGSRVVTGHGPDVPREADVGGSVRTGAGFGVPASTRVGSRAPDESSRFSSNVGQLEAIGEAIAQATPHHHSLTGFDPCEPGGGGHRATGAVDEPHQTRIERQRQQTVAIVDQHTGQPVRDANGAQRTYQQVVTDRRDADRTTPLPFTGRLNVGVRAAKKSSYGESVGLDPAANAPPLGNTGTAIPPATVQARAAALQRHRKIRGAT